MNEQSSTRLDTIKWMLVTLLLACGVVANFYYRDVAWALRLAGWIVLALGAGGIAFTTVQGQSAWGFGKQARIELRKVVWPTRQETVQNTVMVVALVVVMALLMWGIDSTLMWVFNLFAQA